MKKVLRFTFIFTLLLSISHPMLASDSQLTQLVGQKVIFLPTPSDHDTGYRYCKSVPDISSEAVKYDELVGKTAIITAVETWRDRVDLLLENGKKVYIFYYSDCVPYIGLFSDLEAAKKIVGQTIWTRKDTNLDDKTNPETVIELPRFVRCRVLGVEWGPHEGMPLLFTIEMANGKVGIWGGSATGLNPAWGILDDSWYLPPSYQNADDQSATAKVSELLGGWKNILVYTYGRNVGYFAIKPGSLRFIAAAQKESLFEARAADIWNGNKESTLYICAEGKPDDWLYTVSTGQGELPFFKDEVNPPLAENYDMYYVTINDQSKCPLRILGYRILIEDYGTVNVDLIVKNNSQKVIAAFTGSFLMYDKMNHPVTWGGGSNEFRFLCQNTPVPALSSSMAIGMWELLLYDNTRIIKPFIREIRYSDGSIWKRP